jgi:thioredoxin-related protein
MKEIGATMVQLEKAVMRNHGSRTFHLSRRSLVGLSGAYVAAGLFPANATSQGRGSGLIVEPWFLKPSYDLSLDFAAVTGAGKTFAVLWEMPACSWCRLLHAVNFARGEIASYARSNFGFLQLNMTGARSYADFDGEKLPERILAMKHQVASTPTIQFFVPAGAEAPREVGRLAYREPEDFLHMLRFVREKRYMIGSVG